MHITYSTTSQSYKNILQYFTIIQNNDLLFRLIPTSTWNDSLKWNMSTEVCSYIRRKQLYAHACTCIDSPPHYRNVWIKPQTLGFQAPDGAMNFLHLVPGPHQITRQAGFVSVNSFKVGKHFPGSLPLQDKPGRNWVVCSAQTQEIGKQMCRAGRTSWISETLLIDSLNINVMCNTYD